MGSGETHDAGTIVDRGAWTDLDDADRFDVGGLPLEWSVG
jgi:hypothetical protein